MKRLLIVSILFSLCAFSLTHEAQAQGQEQDASAPAEPKPRQVNVDRLKEQYWRKEESVDVVQNRLFPKRNKFELQLFGSVISADPFLTLRGYGGTLGYHFNEYWSLHAMVMKYSVSDSSAATQLRQQTGAAANTNRPDIFYGGELGYSVVYGKLSLAGKSILYYDFHLLAGGGSTETQTGSNGNFHFGLGQQTYINRIIAIRLDYRRMHMRERLTRTGGERTQWSDVIALGATFLIPSFF